MPIRGIILVVFFLGSIPVCFFRPFYGVLLWIILAFVNPEWYAWGAGSWLPWAMLVAIPTLLGALVFLRGWHRLVSREVLILVALWTWFTITSLVSTHTPLFADHASDTWYRWGFVSKILLMTVVIVYVVDSFSRLRTFLLVMAGCFAFIVLKAIPLIILSGGGARLYGPEYSMISDNNDLGLALTMTLPLFFCLAQTETKRWVKLLFAVLVIATIPAIFFTYSRGALVGLVAVISLMILRLKQRVIILPIILLAGLIAFLFAPAAWKERMDPTRPGAVDASARSRLNAWTYCWRLAKESPVTGGGFDTFTPDLFLRYAPDARDVHGPHSIYFGVLAEHGFPGLLLYLSLIGSCFFSSRRLAKAARFYGDSHTAVLADTLPLCLVGFLSSGAFLGRAYFDYFFALVACIAILKRLCQSHWAANQAAEDEISQHREGDWELNLEGA
jgi:probable O-glycosylation ligase (exosortase A-associated)